ncbi:MFS transporter [Candidatus Kaiserbacteria bacterium]|nr:MFS transporter [Candidatus Kaiserbacteria bacterium]
MFVRVNIKFEDFKINRIVKYFILSDLFFLGGWGFVDPIFSIFIVENIEGATLVTVGAVAAVYLGTKSLAQIPIAFLLDRLDGEKDDFYILVISLMMSGVVLFAFTAVQTIPMLFLVVFLKGLAFALYTPSWSAIFSRHLDYKRYAFDWTLDSTTIGLAAGLASFVGGAIASAFGFEMVFIFGSVLSFVSVAVLLLAPDLVLPRGTTRRLFFKDHTLKDPEKIA